MLSSSNKLQKTNIEEINKLTSMQQGILFHYLSESSSRLYHEQLSFQIVGDINLQALRSAFDQVVRANGMLRTVFRWNQLDFPIQIVLKEYNYYYREIMNAPHSRKKLIEGVKLEDKQNQLDISTAPYRVTIVEAAEDGYLDVVLSYHHILLDGWSCAVILREWINQYEQIIHGNKTSLSKKPSYGTFLGWLDQYHEKKEHDLFWNSYVEKDAADKFFPGNYSIKKEEKRETMGYNTSSSFTLEIKEFLQKEQLTLAALFYAAWSLLLYRYNDSERVLFGTVVSGRPPQLNGVEGMVGLFMNTLPFTLELNDSENVRHLLQRIAGQIKDQDEHGWTPLAKIKSLMDKKGESALFESIVVIENYPIEHLINGNSDKVTVKSFQLEESNNFELTLKVTNLEHLSWQIDYNPDRFNSQTVNRLNKQLFCAVDWIIRSVTKTIGQFDLLTKEEESYYQKVNKNISSEVGFASETVITEFVARSQLYADRTAIIMGETEVTYLEFYEHVMRLAERLTFDMQVKPGDVVAVMMDRSIEMLVSIYAIMMAGGVFVPISPDSPSERVKYIYRDSGAVLILTTNHIDELNEQNGKLMRVQLSNSYCKCIVDYKPKCVPTDLAYILYTSGSTGHPKGVLVEHRNLIVTLTDMQHMFPVLSSDTVLFKTTFTFDVSLVEIFGWFWEGGRLAIANSEETKEPQKLLEMILEYQVTHIHFVPSHLDAFLDYFVGNYLPISSKLNKLKYLFAAGEVLTKQTCCKVFNVFTDVRLFNLYGPTEATIFATVYEVDLENTDECVPIGKQFPNAQALIMDAKQRVMPFGAQGELWIAGKGIAKGYVGLEELNLSKFVNHPYIDGLRCYRTGDFARMRSDGLIEFLGRVDHQVKLRGHRIELSEIEHNAFKLQGIRKAAAVVKAGEKGEALAIYLFYTANDDITDESLKHFLSQHLPYYMLPSFYIRKDNLPLQSNGKIDRSLLSENLPPVIAGINDALAPSDEKEQVLLQVWKEVLHAELGINKDCDFYNLGGDSIKAMQIVGRIGKKGYQLKVADVLRYPTLQECAAMMQSNMDPISKSSSIDNGEFHLSPIQKMFLVDMDGGSYPFYQTIRLKSTISISESVLEKALRQLLAHHDALRMEYGTQGNAIYQKYTDNTGRFLLKVFDQSSISQELVLQKLVIGMDIMKGPLVRVGLIKTAEADYIQIVIHHIIVDGVSWRILIEDLETIIHSICSGQQIVLPRKTMSYQDWSNTLTAYTQTELSSEERRYWQHLEKKYEVCPQDILVNGRWGDRASLELLFDASQIDKLARNISVNRRVGVDEFLLTVFAYAHRDWTGQKELWIDIEGHGRQELVDGIDVTRTVGWFTSVRPCLLEIDDSDQPSLHKCIQKLRDVPNYGMSYMIHRQMAERSIEQDLLNFNIKPSYLFNYMGEVQANNGSCLQVEPHSFQTFAGDGLPVQHHIVLNSYMQNGSLVVHMSYDNAVKDFSAFAAFFCKYFNKLSSEGTLERSYVLSPAQKGLLFYKQLYETSPVYFEQVTLRLRGNVSPEAFEKSYQTVLSQHEILRVKYQFGELDEPFQIPQDCSFYELTFHDWTALDKRKLDVHIHEFRNNDRHRGFNLRTEPPIRINIFSVSSEEQIILVSYHHIIMDGWSLSIVLADWFQYLTCLQPGTINSVNSSRSYEWFVDWISRQDKEKAREYWDSYLANYDSKCMLSRNHELVSIESATYQRDRFCMNEELVLQVNYLSEKYKVSTSVLLQAMWGVFLQKYLNIEDAAYGYVTTLRPTEEWYERSVGHYVTTLPMRVNSTWVSFQQIVQELQRDMINNQLFSYYPLYEIQTIAGKGELFDHVLSFDNYPINSEFHSNNVIRIEQVEVSTSPHYPMNLIFELREGIAINTVYQTELYDEGKVSEMISRFYLMIGKLISNPELDIKNLNLLDELEQLNLVQSFVLEPPKKEDETLHGLVERAVKRNPNSIALQFGDNSITYEQLWHQSDQLAEELITRGLEKGDITGIYLERSFDMIIAILAVLKAGGAYLPLDLEAPPARINQILLESSSLFVITHERLATTFNPTVKQVHMANAVALEMNSVQLKSNVQISGIDLAYVIYTSGSTGAPKGVMIEHRSIVNTITWRLSEYGFQNDDVVLQLASVSFDSSVEDIFTTLSAGAKLVLLPQELRLDLTYIKDVILKSGVSHFMITPSLYRAMLLEIPEAVSRVKSVTLAGEPFGEDLVALHYQIQNSVLLFNEYGPTENSVCSTIYQFKKECSKVLLGKPIDNVQCMVVDRDFNPLPNGIIGELCLSGAGLARGYLGQEPLTSQRFLEHPMLLGCRIYRTGDLVEWTSQGQLRYIGRLDEQIKLRGIRIEPMEIESKLLEYEGVRQTVVMSRPVEKENDELVAFIVAQPEIKEKELKTFLAKHFTKQMVPSIFVLLERLPLNRNGKVDKVALKSYAIQRTANLMEHDVLSDIEQYILEIWKDILKVNSVGLEDNFFDCGGNSILLTQVHSRIQQRYPNAINIVDLFENPNISDIASFIKRQTKTSCDRSMNSIPKAWLPAGAQGFKGWSKQEQGIQLNSFFSSGLLEFSEKSTTSLKALLTTFLSLVLYRSIGSEKVVFDVLSEYGRFESMQFEGLKTDFSGCIEEIEGQYEQHGAESGKDQTHLLAECEMVYANEFLPLIVIDDKKQWDIEPDRLRLFDIIFLVSSESEGIRLTCSYNQEKLQELLVNEMLTQFEQAVIRFVHHVKDSSV